MELTGDKRVEMPGCEEPEDLTSSNMSRREAQHDIHSYLLSSEGCRWLPTDLCHPPLTYVDLLLRVED